MIEILAVRWLGTKPSNADFQRDYMYYKRRKLAERSPGSGFPHKLNIDYCTGGMVRSENEARLLYTVEKWLYFAV